MHRGHFDEQNVYSLFAIVAALASPKSGLKGRTCAVAGRKSTAMFNSSAALYLTETTTCKLCTSRDPQIAQMRFLMKQFRGSLCFSGICYGTATNCSILLSEIIAVHGVLRDLRLEKSANSCGIQAGRG